jgi:hypothetical protein
MTSIISSAIGLTLLPGALLGTSGAASDLSATAQSSPVFITAEEDSSWIVGDRYHKVTFNHHVKPWDSENWGGSCPTSHPYLDKQISSNETGGFDIRKESDWLHVVEGMNTRTKAPAPNDRGDYVVGTAGTVTNWATTIQWLYIEMVCTSTPDKGWIVF